ncbi:MAG: SemiSWEET transporter [Bacilli bacterium]|nr:SemiSWEET transporter [Bacilli bacterium]
MNLFNIILVSFNTTDIVGYCATALTAIASLPQFIKILKTRDTKSISLLMFIIFLVAYSLWLAYGIILNNLPMIIGNAVGIFLYIFIISIKVVNIIKGKDSPKGEE